MIHFVIAGEPVGLTACGGNIFVDLPHRDRVTLNRKLVTCPACRLLLAEETAAGPSKTAPSSEVSASKELK